MLRGWQYLCRPTRWRLWEGCRAGRERKNSVRRGQGFLYGGPVRNNAHARRYFSAAKGFWGSDEKKEIRVRSSHRVHDLLWCLSSLEPAVEKKKIVMLRGWQYLCRPTRWRLWEGCQAGQERKNSVRRGQGFMYGGPVRNDAQARRYFSAAKGFWASDIKKKKSALVAATGCMTYCGVCLHSSLRWKKKKSDASRLAVPLQTHQMATVGRMPSRTREEELRQEGSGLPVWTTRPEQCACEESLRWKKKKSDASRLAVPLQTHQMATVGRMPSRTREEELRQEGSGLPVWTTRPERCACEESLRWKKKKKVMLRGWQYLCRPTRWRLWEGCRAGRERKNSVRRGQGFLYGGPVRNNAHARRYFSAAKGFWGSDEKKEIRVRSSHRLHDLLWCLSSLEPAVEKKKIDASRLAVPLQTHQMATVGRMPSRTREEELRQEGQGFLYGGCVRNNAHARRYFSTAKGFWGSDEKKRNPR
ncbi:uncharacterized protein LOC133497105 isoform X8 [Syngnathoides biaculeatus]|nr:uncharacterized protein LOC133497105 isoform X8 [Syngnathoides biaculeatus]XP_061669263.1 uncharacterized protein LOC133497105 isoform X8 [Syngnathoides biaculeatus]